MVNKRTASVDMRLKEVEIPAFSTSEDRSTDRNAHLVRGSCRKKKMAVLRSFQYYLSYTSSIWGPFFLNFYLFFYGVLLLVKIFCWKNKERLLLFIKIEFNGFKEVFLPTPSIEGVIPSIFFL